MKNEDKIVMMMTKDCSFKIRGWNSKEDNFKIVHSNNIPQVSNDFYSMGVKGFTVEYLSLFTFDMFSNRTEGVFNMKDIYDLELIEVEFISQPNHRNKYF